MDPNGQTFFRFCYRRLLRFYPRPFRERFAESMEQTFDDLCREQDGGPTKMLSLTVHLSVDTGIGIVRERILHLSQRGLMTEILKNRAAAAIVGSLLFLPGVAMFALLLFGVDPTEGSFTLFGFQAPGPLLGGYLQSPPDSPHIVGSLIALGLILVLPAIGVMINIAVAEGNALKTVARDLGLAAVIGAVLVLPFLVLEMTIGKVSYSSLPVMLFAILWLLPSTLVLIAAPLVRNFRSGKGLFANPVALVFRLAFFTLIAVFWINLLNDQMPCFLGVPNCD
jgi:hypothetical protein